MIDYKIHTSIILTTHFKEAIIMSDAYLIRLLEIGLVSCIISIFALYSHYKLVTRGDKHE